MSWGAVAGAAVGVVGGMMNDGGGGGGQTSTQSKQPWMPATPWLMDNLAQGQQLQNQYRDQPFNPQQQQAYQNQANQSAYMRAAVPNLLRQMQGQQVGFDRSNPNVRPEAFNWDGLLSASKAGSQGLLDMLNSQAAINSSLDRPQRREEDDKKFIQQDMGYTPWQEERVRWGQNPFITGDTQNVQALGINGGLGTGGYGSYVYGSNPERGTQAYRDMTEYFLMGGNDPWNIAPMGMGNKRAAGLGNQWAGTNNGSGVGSSAPTGNDY